jgi:hypothetical protein
MDDKDKLIYDLQQKVSNLESRVQYLQGILIEAKIPYEMNHSAEIGLNAGSSDPTSRPLWLPNGS